MSPYIIGFIIGVAATLQGLVLLEMLMKHFEQRKRDKEEAIRKIVREELSN